jgi:prophage regulatory protein
MRLLRPRACAAKVGLSRNQLYRLERAGKFPRRVHIGPASVGWVEEEVDEWIRARIAERDADESAECSGLR